MKAVKIKESIVILSSPINVGNSGYNEDKNKIVLSFLISDFQFTVFVKGKKENAEKAGDMVLQKIKDFLQSNESFLDLNNYLKSIVN